MLIIPQALSVAKFASQDTTRPALQNIKIDPDGTVWGTDGCTAVKASPIGEAPDPGYFPLVPGLPAGAGAPTWPVLVPAATALLAMKGAAHRDNPWPFVSVVVSDETAYICTTDGTTHNVTPVLQDGNPAEGGQYPDVLAVWPNGTIEDGANEAGFDAGRLAALAMLAKQHTGKRDTGAMAVTLRGPGTAASLSWLYTDGKRGVQFDAILMPKRLT